jgi:hypothetical protein
VLYPDSTYDATNFGAGADFFSDGSAGIDAASGGWEAAEAAWGADAMSVAEDSAGSSIPYLGAGISAAQGNYGAAAGAVAGSYFGPIGSFIGSKIGGALFDGGDDGGCFLTTATLTALGNKDDNCEELTVLRSYRDTWLQDNHPEDIQEYYRIAPMIVKAINSTQDANEVWKALHTLYILPAVAAVKLGDSAGAYEIYKELVVSASVIAAVSVA